jgi:hypothetical protein
VPVGQTNASNRRSQSSQRNGRIGITRSTVDSNVPLRFDLCVALLWQWGHAKATVILSKNPSASGPIHYSHKKLPRDRTQHCPCLPLARAISPIQIS